MDPFTITTIVVGGIAGLVAFIAGLVQIVQYIEQRREKGAISAQVSKPLPSTDKSLTNTREPSKLEVELKLQERREKAEEAAQTSELSDINLALARVHQSKGELEKAEAFYQAAKSYYLSISDYEKLSHTLVGLAAIYVAQGKLSSAISQAKEIEKITTNPSVLAEAKLKYGTCHRMAGEYPEALNLLQQSLKLWNSLGNRVGAGETFVAIGDVYRKLKKWKEAEQTLIQSIQMLKSELSDKPNNEDAQNHLSQAQYALGRIYIEQQRYDEAKRLLCESFTSLEKTGFFFGIEICSQLMGRLYMMREEWNDARHWYYESFVATHITQNHRRRIETLFYMGELAYLTKQPLRADRLASIASISISDAEKMGILSTLSRLLLLKGHLFCDDTFTDKAINAYQESIIVATRISPLMVEEVFSRLTNKLLEMTKDKKEVTKHIVLELIQWWHNATVDGKKAELFETERLLATSLSQEKPKRVSRYLLELQEKIAER